MLLQKRRKFRMFTLSSSERLTWIFLIYFDINMTIFLVGSRYYGCILIRQYLYFDPTIHTRFSLLNFRKMSWLAFLKKKPPRKTQKSD
jgi:hypothetical protein